MAFREARAAGARGRSQGAALSDLVRGPIAIARTILEASDLAWDDQVETAELRGNRTHSTDAPDTATHPRTSGSTRTRCASSWVPIASSSGIQRP